MQEKGTAIETKLLFFELEWAALDDEHADELLATDGLDFARHHLRTARRYRPHLLSEPEEKILAEKALTGRTAWTRLFEEQTRRSRSTLDDEPSRSRSRSRSRTCSPPTAPMRAHAAERVTAALEPGLRTRGYAFNTLLADKMVDDRLRGYPHWLAAATSPTRRPTSRSQALIDRGPQPLRAAAPLVPPEGAAARARPARRLRPHGRRHAGERAVAVGGGARPRARLLRTFSAELGDIVRRFFDERVDRRAGAAGQARRARSAPTPSPRVHPYVMLNCTHRRRDVLTLAHELGHGVHAALGGRQGIYHMATPLTLAETASVFGETLVFGRLLERRPRRRSRGSSLLAESIEGSIATVFRQVAMNRFEHLIHTERREHGRARRRPLRRAVGAVAGGAARRRGRGHRGLPLLVVLRAPLRRLAGLRLRVRLRAAARARRLRPLPGGGRRRSSPPTSTCSAPAAREPPEELGEIVGVDLADPGFWDPGLALVERQLDAAEQAARDAGRL